MTTLDRARRLFEGFFGRPPGGEEILTLDMREPVDAIVVGPISRIFYVSEGPTGLVEESGHTFKENCRPLLLVSYDGKQLYALRGRYEFTERGFVDGR
jgi:hypothetical protein